MPRAEIGAGADELELGETSGAREIAGHTLEVEPSKTNPRPVDTPTMLARVVAEL